MKKYFVAKEGIQKGPWSIDEITKNIEGKKLRWSDYIYNDKTKVWLFLFEFPQLTVAFNQSFVASTFSLSRKRTAESKLISLERCPWRSGSPGSRGH